MFYFFGEDALSAKNSAGTVFSLRAALPLLRIAGAMFKHRGGGEDRASRAVECKDCSFFCPR